MWRKKCFHIPTPLEKTVNAVANTSAKSELVEPVFFPPPTSHSRVLLFSWLFFGQMWGNDLRFKDVLLCLSRGGELAGMLQKVLLRKDCAEHIFTYEYHKCEANLKALLFRFGRILLVVHRFVADGSLLPGSNCLYCSVYYVYFMATSIDLHFLIFEFRCWHMFPWLRSSCRYNMEVSQYFYPCCVFTFVSCQSAASFDLIGSGFNGSSQSWEKFKSLSTQDASDIKQLQQVSWAGPG